MNIEKQLETAVRTNHLVLVVFYADWSASLRMDRAGTPYL